SPYAALTAFALDPIYLSLDAVEDFAAAGGEAALGAALESARAGGDIDYDAVRAVKRRALEVAFARFVATEWEGGSARAEAFRRFRAAEAAWLDDYALFRALRERHGGWSWTAWEPPLRARVPAALAEARDTLARARLFHEYVQWVAAEQWAAARREATAFGVRLMGDLAFMLSANSADVWARQEEFARDPSLGAPPDAFSRGGQDWGLPVCRWEVMARNDHAWLRARVARAAALFAAVRLDHVVGFYRQFVIPSAGPRHFVPAEEAEQLALGERLLGVVRAAAGAAGVTGEDLGVVPDFVRRSLATLAIPGYRVLRWERDGDVFRDPAGFPPLSVATSGTHDTSALAVWWEEEVGAAARRAQADRLPVRVACRWRRPSSTTRAASSVAAVPPPTAKRPSGSGEVTTPTRSRYARACSTSDGLTHTSRSADQRYMIVSAIASNPAAGSVPVVPMARAAIAG